jgi:preprotein translocase subunit SecG
MSVLSIILLVFFIIVSILLVLLVIVQDQDSDDLGGIFSGSSSSAFGSQATNVVVKFTYVLGALFFVLAFSLALLNRSHTGAVEEAAMRKAGKTTNEWWSAEGKAEAPLPDASGAPQGLTPQGQPVQSQPAQPAQPVQSQPAQGSN